MTQTAPVIALVGRPNVGKSTLFNQLTRSRNALVADKPGLTRDRQYGLAEVGDGKCLIVDTGGMVDQAEGLDADIFAQTGHAIDEAALILFLVDAREGITAADELVARTLRSHSKRVVVVANKAEGQMPETAAADFHSLGFGDPQVIAAAHGQGITDLRDFCAGRVQPAVSALSSEQESEIRVAFVGRPNVGKSTLVNRLVGEQRVIASDEAGTTRDSVEVPFEVDGRAYTLIDTAGVRRRTKVHETFEKFSVIKTLQAVEACNVVVMMVDARQGVGSQDARLLGLIAQAGRALVIAVNKWDGLAARTRRLIMNDIDRKLPFLDFAPLVTISALHGSGLTELLNQVSRAHASAFRELPTSQVTRTLLKAVEAHSPPSVGGRRVKLRHAHQGGRNPPTIVIHGNQTEKLNATYQRYLNNEFRKAFDLVGTPIDLQFRTGDNPFKHKRNVLTPTQQRKRKRLIQHSRKR